MITETFTVLNPSGFHARPTKTFVQKASTFPCKINVSKNDKTVNGKSSLSMLTLGIENGDSITLEIDGEQEKEAMEQLGQLLVHIFEE